jgi:hypothetical protein
MKLGERKGEDEKEGTHRETVFVEARLDADLVLLPLRICRDQALLRGTPTSSASLLQHVTAGCGQSVRHSRPEASFSGILGKSKAQVPAVRRRWPRTRCREASLTV